MLRSYSNRLLAVRRVTQLNAGKNTPGVDKLTIKTSEARGKLTDDLRKYEIWKAQPVLRVYIPKANGKKRPLGIPVMTDRAIQSMVKNALEPFGNPSLRDQVTVSDQGEAAMTRLRQYSILQKVIPEAKENMS